MATKLHFLDGYKKFLLNRMTVTSHLTEYIENILVSDESYKYLFHKVMIHNWPGDIDDLCDVLSEYFMTGIIPINVSTNNNITAFYTSNLNLVLKIMRQDFVFLYQRNMYNIDVMFYDKISTDIFQNNVTLDDIVTGVVCQRFTGSKELDLSNFCNDPELAEKNIYFYKVNLLSYFKILMLRMGKDTKTLNLSHNNLSQVPLDVINFFIKGELTGINLSHNNIPSLTELLRASSKIEKLWLEGNPLCANYNSASYIKSISVKFPRITELDGIQLNQQCMMMPFFKNFVVSYNKRTRMVVDKFLTLYFTAYDSKHRRRIKSFYAPNAVFTFSTKLTEQQEKNLPYAKTARNLLNPTKRELVENRVMQRGQDEILTALCNFSKTIHDPPSFTVDVLHHDEKSMYLVVDGLFKDITIANSELIYQFRRSFIFSIRTKADRTSEYQIRNEMFTIGMPTQEQVDNSFKHPTRNLNTLMLINPDREEKEEFIKALGHLTKLKKSEAETRLEINKWDFAVTLKEYCNDVKNDKIQLNKLMEDDDLTDLSSIGDVD